MTSPPETKALDATTVNYFYGRLSRHEAERILMDKGCCDGLFLLRLSLTKPDDYALAICSGRRIHHYTIERQSDGQVKMEGGKKYPGPLELIKHHKTTKDGLVEKPKVPCSRPEGMLPYVWPGVTISDLDNAIDRKYTALYQRGLVSRRQKMLLLPVVAKEMHKHQAWFFGQLSRDEAERYLLQSRLKLNGKYLVRERCDGSLVLSMLHQNRPWHYKVTETAEGKYNIELGPEFDTIMDLITFYHNGGLLCRLTVPCERHTGTPSTPSARNLHFNPVYSTRERLRQLSPLGNSVSSRGRSNHPGIRSSSESSSASPTYRRMGGDYPSRDYHPEASAPPLPSASSCSDFRRHTYLDLEDDASGCEDDVYQVARRAGDGDMVRIRKDQLKLEASLGCGHFGSVRKASYILQGQGYSVAVKTLKSEAESQEELIKEAQLMSKLDNPYIIRLIGVCQPDPGSFMLVVELAPNGSLRDYLKRNQETPMHIIVEFLHQVARGMAYLERHKVVHRDLAARNILLYTERHAKISDFGLSRNLGALKDYYESTKEEQWPIRWYPPEVLHNKKFASKSDVWSFGVTMWEATSYAETPYKDLLAEEYREKLDQGYRMPRPPNCPRSVYRIMLLCWAERKEDRPSFREILQQFELLPPA